MSQNETVTLHIKSGNNSGSGWTDTTGSNGLPYSFKYTGGQNDNGNMSTKVNSGTANIALDLDTDQQRYSLGGVNFNNDTYSQLSWAPQDAKSGNIVDINTQVETATYCVSVIDTQSGGASIPCDPMISNDPRTPMARIMHQ